MSSLVEMQSAMERMGNKTCLAKTGRVAMSRALYDFYESARFGNCPDLPIVHIPIFVDDSFGDTEFKILTGRRYL